MALTITTNNSLTLKSSKSYLLASAFLVANLVLPQVFHYFNLSATAFLPIIFFSMVAAICYGRSVALLTAIFSPIVSYLIFGMPSLEMSLVVITKGVAFVLALSYLAAKFTKFNATALILSIVAYQIAGFVVASIIFNANMALTAAFESYPAIIMQLLGGFAIIKMLKK